MRRTGAIIARCLMWAAVAQANLSSLRAQNLGGCERGPEIRRLTLDALRPSAPSEITLPALEEVTCSGFIPRQEALEVGKVRWDAVLRSFEVRLRCKTAGACLPFLAHVRPRPDEQARGSAARSAAPDWANVTHRLQPERRTSGPATMHPIVRPGQAVTLFWEGGGMRITRTVICLDSGSLGQEVRTRGKDGGRLVRAQVVAVGLVKAML